MAAKGLSRLHTGAALEPLAGTLSDSNEYVRKMAARAVAGIGGSEARDRLEKAFSKETDPGVKSAIMDLIAGIKEE